MYRRAAILVALAGLLCATPLWAQSRLWRRPNTNFWVAPYGGLPLATGSPGLLQAVGVHLVWPTGRPLTLAGRYESRWETDGLRSDAFTLDMVGRLVGVDQSNFNATVGWIHWRQHYMSAGLRAMWPFLQPQDGHSVVQGWFDLRYAAPLTDLTGKGIYWAELMLSFVLPVSMR